MAFALSQRHSPIGTRVLSAEAKILATVFLGRGSFRQSGGNNLG